MWGGSHFKRKKLTLFLFVFLVLLCWAVTTEAGLTQRHSERSVILSYIWLCLWVDMALLWQTHELGVKSHTSEWLAYSRIYTQRLTRPVYTLYFPNSVDLACLKCPWMWNWGICIVSLKVKSCTQIVNALVKCILWLWYSFVMSKQMILMISSGHRGLKIRYYQNAWTKNYGCDIWKSL